MKKLLITVIPFLLMLGCSVLQKSPATGLAVQYATLKFIEKAEPERRVARAQKIITYASTAKTLFDQNALPVTEVESLIRQKIKWAELSPADTILVNALITAVTEEVHSRYSGTNTDIYITGSVALTWIIQGAKIAGG